MVRTRGRKRAVEIAGKVRLGRANLDLHEQVADAAAVVRAIAGRGGRIRRPEASGTFARQAITPAMTRNDGKLIPDAAHRMGRGKNS